MRILFAGTPASAVVPLKRLLEEGLDIVGVLTRPDAPQGRRRVLTPSPVAARGEEIGLPVIKARTYDDAADAAVRELAPDVAAVVAYGAILPARALEAVPHGWINLHFSDLPEWRGAAPVQRAMMAGRKELTAVTFRIEQGLDTGPVYGSVTEPVGEEDTAGSMLERLGDSGGRLLARTLREIEQGTARPEPQQGEPTHAAKLTLEDARLSFERTAAELEAQVRGVSPEPGAWAELNGERIKIEDLRGTGEPAEHPAGTVRLQGRKVLLSAADEDLVLGRIQPAGKKMMPAPDWARGAGRLKEGPVRFS